MAATEVPPVWMVYGHRRELAGECGIPRGVVVESIHATRAAAEEALAGLPFRYVTEGWTLFVKSAPIGRRAGCAPVLNVGTPLYPHDDRHNAYPPDSYAYAAKRASVARRRRRAGRRPGDPTSPDRQ